VLNPLTAQLVGDEVVLTASGKLDTAMMSIIGQPTMPLGSVSAVVYDIQTPIEMTLVLDTSGSMGGQKLTDLKASAKSLVDVLLPSAIPANNGPVKVSVVPFAHYVNVGTDKRFESWIDVESDYDEYSWYGCVESRGNPLNVQDDSFLTDPVVGFVTTNGNLCPAPIQELTNSQQKAYDAIDALTARNYTYIAAGLTWGLRTLSPGAPFSEGEDYVAFADKDGRKALVLMSDGANTRSVSSSGLHNSSDVSEANKITLEVCAEVKAKEIEVYTIAFELDDETTKTMLEACATTTDWFYDAKDAAALQLAFDDIGRSLTELAISR